MLTREDTAIFNGVYARDGDDPAAYDYVKGRSNTRYPIREAMRENDREDARSCEEDLTDYMQRIADGIARQYTTGVRLSIEYFTREGKADHPYAVY